MVKIVVLLKLSTGVEELSGLTDEIVLVIVEEIDEDTVEIVFEGLEELVGPRDSKRDD